MRTSGADADTALLLLPICVLIVLTVIWMGGPSSFLRDLNDTVLEGVAWIASLWR